MDRRRLNKLNDNKDPIPIFALHKQMTIVLNNLKPTTANKYQAHVFFFDSILGPNQGFEDRLVRIGPRFYEIF